MSGFGRIALIGAVLAGGLGIAEPRAQTVLGDPRDAAKTFASNCSACHKSPQGLAKSGQVAGFLRQHYTTGPEMSAAMAAYLVAAGVILGVLIGMLAIWMLFVGLAIEQRNAER